MTEPARSIDLNADLGEGCPWDEDLLDRVTSASVCCGAHAGDRATSLQTLRLAAARHVVVGAHPGYADRVNFGRKELELSRSEVACLVREQVEGLAEIARSIGLELRFVKPHGALYNQAQRDEVIAAGVIDAVGPLGLPLLGLPGSVLDAAAVRAKLRYLPEGFADRRYGPDGRLVPRGTPGAILDDPAEIEAQVLRLIDRGVATLCIHGDDPRAVALADRVRAIVRKAGIVARGLA